MTRRYVRVEPSREETVSAVVASVAVGAGVGLVTYYFARMLLSRQEVSRGEDGVQAVGPASEREVLDAPRT